MRRNLLLFYILISTITASATHLVGGSFSYQCLNASTNQYQFTMILYRDCNGAATLPSPSTTAYIYPSAGSPISITMTQTSLSTVTLTNDPCLTAPPGLCYQKGVYTGTVTLASSTGGYTIAWSNCCRNNTVTNILNPGSIGFIISASIPNPLSAPCNSSPTFVNDPPALFCLNSPINFNYSAVDPNGDSLSYKLCPSKGIASTGTNPGPPPYPNVPYSGTYGGTNPLPANPSLAINPVTGMLTGTPTQTGQYAVTVCVEEWRNGVKIGEYPREYQFNIVNCTFAVIANIASTNDTIRSCDSYTVSFTNNSSGSTNYKWDFGVPGTNADTSNIASPTYTYPDTGVYVATLIADPGSQCADTAYVTVMIYPTIDAAFTYSGQLCTGNPISFTNNSTTTFGTITSNNWTFGFGVPPSTQTNPTVVFNLPGNFNVKLVVTNSFGCKDSVINTLQMIASPSMNAGPDKDICLGDSVVLSSSSSGTVTWTPATGLSCTNCVTPTASPTVTTTYIATAVGTNGCSRKDTVVVNVQNKPTVNAGQDLILCNIGSGQLQGTVSGVTGNYTVSWSPTTGLTGANTLTPTANPISTTQYILTATTSAGCSSKDTVIVYRNILSVNAGQAGTICLGDSIQLNATSPNAGTYSWSPANSVTNANISNPKAFPVATTIYTVTLTDTAGCTATSTVSITVNSNNSVDAGQNVSICSGSSTTLTATGGNSYVWDAHPSLSCTNCASPTASPTVTTTFYVTGYNSSGCPGRDSVTVTVNALPTFTVSAGSPAICLGGSTTLSASGTGLNYTWAPSTGLSCTNCAAPTASPQATTTYTVTATDNNGCTSTQTITLTVNPLPNVDAGPDTTGLCIGKSKQLNATGAVSYSWTPTTTLSCSNCPNPMANPTTTTTYIVTGTDANGCVNKDTITINVQPFLPITVTPNSNLCIGSTLQLNATGGTMYQWTPSTALSNPNISNPVASPTSTTTYTVQVTDANGCSNTGTVTITVNQLPTISAGSPATICEGSTTTLNASGGVSYIWSPAASLNNANIINPVASPVSTTTYTVTGTDANGCSNTSSVTVTVNPKPTVNAGTDISICVGQSTQLQAQGATSYSWTPASSLSNPNIANPTATPASTTTYIVTGTGANNCTNKDTVVVTVNNPPVLSFNPGQPTICIGDSINLSVSGANSYQWLGPNLTCNNCASPIAYPTATTTYTVIGFNGCYDTSTVTVTVNPLPSVTISPDDTICYGSTASLSASGGINYSWNPATSLNNPNLPNVIASPATTQIYTVSVTDNNGCSNTASVKVLVNQLPTVSAGTDKIICINDSVALNATGAISYQWSPSSGLSCTTCPNPVAKPTNTTQYIVTGTDGNGCVNSDTVLVTVNQKPNITITPDSDICIGDNINLQATGGNYYTWSPATGLSNPNIANPVASPQVTTTYTVTVDNGCLAYDSVTITVNPLPQIIASADTAVCEGETANISASGGNSYSWSPAASLNNPNVANPLASPISTTTYTVTGTDANGCQNTASVQVIINMPADPLAGIDANICIGDTVYLTASNGITYQWSPAVELDDPSSSTPMAVPTGTTIYTVTITDNNGCENTDVVNITVNQPPNIDAGQDVSIYFGETVILSATGGVSYHWSPEEYFQDPDKANALVYPLDTTMFYVTGTDINGCKNSDSVMVFVLGQSVVNMPTAFSPNDDGRNDIFYVGYTENFNLVSLKVFNRWGEILFITTDPSGGWDGKYKGTPQPIGTYIFLIEGLDDLGKPVQKFGNITLVR